MLRQNIARFFLTEHARTLYRIFNSESSEKYSAKQGPWHKSFPQNRIKIEICTYTTKLG